ncbi:MAG: hypothetical protein FRX49_08063 [Trebouxia sp. A1-2]|nr:MAG: hypothetical protein FRX49_08063 [Trebouxia sp. A1-2]
MRTNRQHASTDNDYKPLTSTVSLRLNTKEACQETRLSKRLALVALHQQNIKDKFTLFSNENKCLRRQPRASALTKSEVQDQRGTGNSESGRHDFEMIVVILCVPW